MSGPWDLNFTGDIAWNVAIKLDKEIAFDQVRGAIFVI
jgi:hypothetical protein